MDRNDRFSRELSLPLFPGSLALSSILLPVIAGLTTVLIAGANRYLVPFLDLGAAYLVPVFLVALGPGLPYSLLAAVAGSVLSLSYSDWLRTTPGSPWLHLMRNFLFLGTVGFLASYFSRERRKTGDTQRETKERVKRLSALHVIDKAILSDRSLRENLALCARVVAGATGADMAVIWELDEDKRYLEVAASWGASSKLQDEIKKTRVRVGEGSAGWAIFQGKPTAIGDALNDPRFERLRPVLEGEGVRSALAAPLTINEEHFGAISVAVRRRRNFRQEDISFVEGLSKQLSIAIHQAKLLEQVRELTFQTIAALAEAMDARDAITAGHALRVGEYAAGMGRTLHLPEEDCNLLRIAGILHDVGKIGVREDVLMKPSKLTAEEMENMKLHPLVGAEILKRVKALSRAAPWIEHHHEHLDGSGYPSGLAGNAIPIQSRILLVADCFDAMTNDRPYRKGMSLDRALAELEKNSGRQFDPQVVKAFTIMPLKDIGSQTP